MESWRHFDCLNVSIMWSSFGIKCTKLLLMDSMIDFFCICLDQELTYSYLRINCNLLTGPIYFFFFLLKQTPLTFSQKTYHIITVNTNYWFGEWDDYNFPSWELKLMAIKVESKRESLGVSHNVVFTGELPSTWVDLNNHSFALQ